ncbi:MAG: hypothetical protein AAGI68_02780 [Planctomycetota bacterium]
MGPPVDHTHCTMTRDARRAAVVLVTCLAQVTLPYLPRLLRLTEDIGSRSDADRTLLTPPGYAFAIWGPLFLGSLAYAITQALPRYRDRPLFRRTGYPAAIAFAANAAWAVYVPLVALDFFSFLLLVLGLTALLIAVARIRRQRTPTLVERGMALPLLALAGWLTAATMLGVAYALLPSNPGLASLLPTLIGGALVATAVAYRSASLTYAAAAAWAFLTIGLSNLQSGSVVLGSAALAAALVIPAAALARKTLRRNRR